jgi:hypothetical protein
MRRNAVIALVMLLATRAWAADPVVPPTLSAVAPRWDAGRVEAGTQLTHTYELRNRGTTPLPILVKPQCGCTTTDYDRVIPAGGTGKVTVALDTSRMRGRVEKAIDVTSNDQNGHVLTLTILADSVRTLVVSPTDTPTVRGTIGALHPIELTVAAPDDARFEIRRVEDAPSLRVHVAPADATAKPPHRRYRLTLTPQADLAVGSHPSTIAIETTLTSAPRFLLQANVVVSGPLVTMPPQLQLRPGAPPLSVRVVTTTQAPFHVLRADVSDPDFAADYVAVANEPAWDVTVRYTGKPSRHGQVNAVVKLATDVTSQPFVLVRLSGKL